MLSRSEAQARATNYATDRISDPLVLADVHPTGYGWVFTFNTESAVATGDWQEDLIGLGPLLVIARDGTVSELGTAHSLEQELRAYEEAMGRGAEPSA